MKTARQVAAEALLRVEGDKAWSNLALDHMIRGDLRDPREAAFATALFYGALERKLTLDACIAAHSKTKPERLSPVVKNIVRISIYQLLYLDSVPDHSAVHEGVELAKRMGMAKAAGFVNGVLRSFLRAGKRVPLPEGSAEDRLSVEYSAPAALIRMWREAYGAEQTEEILRASLGRPPVFIRVNTLKTTLPRLAGMLSGRGVSAEPVPGVESCLKISGQGDLRALPEFGEGLFHVQDVSSQLCVRALDVGPGMRVLDACAAPGGKSFTIAQLLAGKGELVSAELHAKRASLMKKQAERMGITSMTALRADMSQFQPELGLFDRVLCDAPCSGLGVVRRKPEIKYKDLEEFSGLPEIQYKILSAVSQYCRAGGILLYSTCTLNPRENGDIARKFLEEQPGFGPSPLPGPWKASWERTLTGGHGGDGFYLAGFVRRE